MGRVLSILVFALVAAALLLLPPAEPIRISALHLGRLLDVETDVSSGPRMALGDALMASSAVVRDDQGRATLRLGGVRIVSTGEMASDLLVHGLARRSLVSALRQRAHTKGLALSIEGDLKPLSGGLQVLIVHEPQAHALTLQADAPDGARIDGRMEGWHPPGRDVLVPPLVAVLLAILFRRPVLALFAGVWAACALVLWRDPAIGVPGAVFGGLRDVVTELLWPEIQDPDRLHVVGFVLAMLAMVGVMTKSGGIRGLMVLIARFARTARRTQVATWLAGLVVFFDDYANCLLVGSTMRPLCDRFRVSREKLAYLVDSTAAPVAGLSLFSTWIAFEVSTFSPQLPAAGLTPADGYAVFLETLPFRFYCILTLVLSGAVALTGRDFGPMLGAERRARATGQLVRPGARPMLKDAATALEPVPGVVPRAHRAWLPLLAFLLVSSVEVARVGFAALRVNDPQLGLSDVLSLEGLASVFAKGECTHALLVGSACGLALAIVLGFLAGIGRDVLRASWTTLRSTGIAVAVLYLAWMTGRACARLGTAQYLTALLGGQMAPELLPAVLFLTSGAIAMATGSAWSTMSILLPLVVGLAFELGTEHSLGGPLLMALSIGAVLEGSIFGDHCSPMSDTTVLASTASASDHLDHVRTQTPYALVAMAAALFLGYLPCGFSGHQPFLALALASGAVIAVLWIFGKRVPSPETPSAP
jgi:Na+/H+ antiporter NhaC